MIDPFDDIAPASDGLTDYDCSRVRLYVRLLDAEADSAGWQEVVSVLFGIAATHEPDRARKVYDSHLARAQWMSKAGHRGLFGRAF